MTRPDDSGAELTGRDVDSGADLVAREVDWGVRGVRILHEVALRAVPGSTVGLLGPNGSGKSSLLRLLAGLGRPDAGGVLLDGEPLVDLPRRRLARRIAVVHQQVSPDVDMSTLDVLLLGRIPHRPRLAATSATDLDLARRALADAGLAGFERRRWSGLSGGERQRVDIARALLQEPDLLLLDEPTNHLDVRHQLELLHFLAASPMTVVVTLHDVDLAAQYLRPDRPAARRTGGRRRHPGGGVHTGAPAGGLPGGRRGEHRIRRPAEGTFPSPPYAGRRSRSR